MVGTDVTLEAAIVVGLQHFQDAGIAVAIPMGGFREVAVIKVLDVTDVGKSDAVAMLADDVGHVVVGVGVKAAGAKGQAVAGMVHHLQEAVNILLIDQQTGQAEDIPGGIVHVDGHLDAGLLAGGHQSFQEVLQVGPQLLMIHIGIGLKQLVQLGHALGLPAGEGHIVLLGEVQDVLGHGVVVVLDHAFFVEQSGGAVADLVEEVGAGPVEDGHEVVADDLDAELGKVAHGLLVVFDQLIPGGQADLDVVVDVDGLYHVTVEAVGMELIHHFSDLALFPNFAWHLVVQSPDDAGDAGNLLDVIQADLIVALAVPTETHLHWHNNSSQRFCAFSYEYVKSALILYDYSTRHRLLAIGSFQILYKKVAIFSRQRIKNRKSKPKSGPFGRKEGIAFCRGIVYNTP